MVAKIIGIWKVNGGLKVKGGWKVKGCYGCLEMVLLPLLKEKKDTAIFRHARFC